MMIPANQSFFFLPLAFGLGDIWNGLKDTASQNDVVLVTVSFLLVVGLLLRQLPAERSRVRASTLLFFFALFLLFASSLIAQAGLLSLAGSVYWAALLIGGIAIVNICCILLFGIILRFLKLPAPRILRDMAAAFGYIGVGFALLTRAEVSLSSLITTSAVLTAVIAFSLQDTLGNMLGGLALQMEDTINVGDWVRIDQVEGQVRELRWRYTAIETRNWDTVIIPNSVLVKGQVVLLGRRTDQPIQHRQALYFNVDFRVPPTDVISTVDQALQAEPIPNVATEPKAHCIFQDFKESYAVYAVRYWLTDMAVDAPTDSTVRTRVYFALKRANIPLSIPAQTVFVTEETKERKSFKHDEEVLHRLDVLKGVELFQTLSEEELKKIAERLRPAPFTRGEALTRQGAEAHWLYIITIGSAEVTVSIEDGSRKSIAVLRAGDFFGEMGLMTGEKRSATVTALEDTECYRLDKEGFQDILLGRPEIVEYISHILARRRMEYEAARDDLDQESQNRKMAHTQRAIFDRITKFFGLGSAAKL